MAACRGTRIEWFSDCSNHCGALCTPAGFRSQASCQHFTRDITTWHENNGGIPSILSITCLGIHGGSCAQRSASSLPSIASTQLAQWRRGAVSHRHFATGTSLPYDARPGSPGFDTEVSHATQERAPRRRLVSRSQVSDGGASLPRLGSNAERASLAATKSSERSSVATIHARATLAGDFKNCCMLSGEFDGSDRHHFFQAVMPPSKNRWNRFARLCVFRAAGPGRVRRARGRYFIMSGTITAHHRTALILGFLASSTVPYSCRTLRYGFCKRSRLIPRGAFLQGGCRCIGEDHPL
jgi:hypothetical protein